MLVSQSKHLKVSLEERTTLELVLNNCKQWECEAQSLLDDARCLFELDYTVHGISGDLMFKVGDLIARIQSAITSGVSLGFDFSDISKLLESCSTLQWCKRALCFCNHSPSLEVTISLLVIIYAPKCCICTELRPYPPLFCLTMLASTFFFQLYLLTLVIYPHSYECYYTCFSAHHIISVYLVVIQ